MTLTPYASAAPDLTALGYTPIPLISPFAPHGGKGLAPGDWRSGRWQGMPRWQRFRDAGPSTFETRMWTEAPEANVGIVMGTPAGNAPDGTPLHVIGLDFDAIDPDVLDALLRAAPASPMVKRGSKGETRLYRAPKTVKTRAYDGPDGRLLDVLGGFDTRQTVVPPSISPRTEKPYVWLKGPVPARELPILTEADMEALEEALEQCGWSRSGLQRRETRPCPVEIDPDDMWTEVKTAAMSRLGDWVPDLDLYNLKRARQGYECVEHWRASGTGRPLSERKRNLSIQPDGIKDWGSNNTYSAIDLVMAARDCDQAEATDWLRGKLGLKDDGVVIELAPQAVRKIEPAISASDAAQPVAVPVPDAPQSVSTELPEHLTHVPGLVGQITDWITDSARRPNRPFALGVALLLVGTAAGRRIAGPTGSGTHLYVLGLADTGSGKDHALNAIPTVLSAAGMQAHVGRGEFMSHQAVYRDLMRQPLTLCPMDEFGSFLKKVNNRNGAGSERAITGVLRTAWGKSFSTMPSPGWATQGSDPIHSPAFSLFGATTDREFYTAIDGGDIDNGFLNRFLLISTKARPESRTPLVSRHVVPEAISDALSAIYSIGGPLYSATMHNGAANEPVAEVEFANPHVDALFKRFENAMIKRATNEPLVARTAEMAIRLATIRAIGMQGPTGAVVTTDDMEWAIELCSWSTERLIADVVEHMAENPLQAESKRIQRLIRLRGRMKHRDLLRALGGRLKSRELEDILKGLKDAELIGIEKVTPPAGGPPSVWYSAIED